MRTARLRMRGKSVSRRPFRKVIVVVDSDQVSHRAAKIEKKPIAGIPAVYDAAGHNRQVRYRIVPSQPDKLLAEIGRPIRAI